MDKHRKVMGDELNKGVCLVCEFHFSNLIIHHKDGNKKNNKRDNLLPVCSLCHNYIHKGLKSFQPLTKERIEKINHYRFILLKNTQKENEKDIKEKLDYEKMVFNPKGFFLISKKRCYLCHSTKEIKLLCNDLIQKYSQTPKKYSIPICKKCLKNW